MSNTDDTFGYTKQDIAKMMAQESKAHGGNIPANSEAAGLQSIIDSATKNKDELIEERKANLPLPDAPPGASDFNSADARTVNVGSGGVQGDISAGGAGSTSGLREPASVDSADDMNVGRTAKDNLGGIPSDAVTTDKRSNQGTVETRGADYGYPSQNDPSSGVN